MVKRHYHHGELRNALLDAAEALVRERGVDGWSLREASARVGVSSSAVYHHFASRDVLVRALSERALTQLGERMSQAAGMATEPGASVDHLQCLVAVGRSYVQWALEDPSVARLAFGARTSGPGAEISPHPHDVLDAELDRLVEAGALPTSARPGADFVVWAAIHGLATLLADGLAHLDSPEAIARETERVVRAVLTGLRQETAPSRSWPAVRSTYTERRAEQESGDSAIPSPANAPAEPEDLPQTRA
ncbi:TetR/AcrR family transcriptional regulator [Streptomyces sp. NPDC050564]|uniref:TetR/AcrR family transcriptional regulator n=1 Tax=Streptomyces sp. NPDC050564 TaxID=3365631 RepID=UPI003788822E